MPDALLTLTKRMGFTDEDRRAIAKWWVDSGQARWDKSALPASPACYMEINEFIDECVRGNLAVLRADMRASVPKKTLKARVRSQAIS